MSRLRSLATLMIIITVAWLSMEYDLYLERKAYVEWVTSPKYQIQEMVAKRRALFSAAYNKYDHFKLDCLAFGSDMKLLKSMEAANHSPEFQERLKHELYLKQFTLLERWFAFDAILYPGASDMTIYMDYYKHLKPRSI
jgi:hypothetical protein